jgi:hypothetical protein
MRFTAASVILAGAASASLQNTVTSTATATITDCPATVTDCPASKTSTSVYSYTVSTIYTTSVKTITSCSAKPSCTAGEGHTTAITVTIPQTTTTCILTDEPPHSTKGHNNSTSKPPHTKTETTKGQESTSKPVTLPPPTTKPNEPACPTYSVKTISTSTTVVVPTVIYETVSIPCPPPATETKPPVKPTPSGGLPGCTGANCTTKPPPVQAGAASFTASGIFAAAAGVLVVALL